MGPRCLGMNKHVHHRMIAEHSRKQSNKRDFFSGSTTGAAICATPQQALFYGATEVARLLIFAFTPSERFEIAR